MFIPAVTLGFAAAGALILPPADVYSLVGTGTLNGSPTFANQYVSVVQGAGTNLTILRNGDVLTIQTDVSMPVFGGPAVIQLNKATHKVTGWWFTTPTEPIRVHGTFAGEHIEFFAEKPFKDETHHIGYFGLNITRKADGTVDIAYGDLISNKPSDLAQGLGKFQAVETANFKMAMTLAPLRRAGA